MCVLPGDVLSCVCDKVYINNRGEGDVQGPDERLPAFKDMPRWAQRCRKCNRVKRTGAALSDGSVFDL